MTDRYPTADPATLESNEYSEHLKALESLKGVDGFSALHFIATQLALRDREIARLKESIEEKAGELANERTARIEQQHAALQERMRQSKATLRSERDAALTEIARLKDELARVNEAAERTMETEQYNRELLDDRT